MTKILIDYGREEDYKVTIDDLDLDDTFVTRIGKITVHNGLICKSVTTWDKSNMPHNTLVPISDVNVGTLKDYRSDEKFVEAVAPHIEAYIQKVREKDLLNYQFPFYYSRQGLTEPFPQWVDTEIKLNGIHTSLLLVYNKDGSITPQGVGFRLEPRSNVYKAIMALGDYLTLVGMVGSKANIEKVVPLVEKATEYLRYMIEADKIAKEFEDKGLMLDVVKEGDTLTLMSDISYNASFDLMYNTKTEGFFGMTSDCPTFTSYSNAFMESLLETMEDYNNED